MRQVDGLFTFGRKIANGTSINCCGVTAASKQNTVRMAKATRAGKGGWDSTEHETNSMNKERAGRIGGR